MRVEGARAALLEAPPSTAAAANSARDEQTEHAVQARERVACRAATTAESGPEHEAGQRERDGGLREPQMAAAQRPDRAGARPSRARRSASPARSVSPASASDTTIHAGCT